MRVIALGGAGDMGRVSTRMAARTAGIEELVVADLDIRRARALAGELDGDPATRAAVMAEAVDVTDARALGALLTGADIVLNTTGPFFRFGVPVLEAAIATATSYLDICDDWQPTLAMLGLDDRARAAGVTAVIGMGASPGVSNLLAARAARELDVVEDLWTAWPVDVGDDHEDIEALAPEGRVSAAAVHWMAQLTGHIRVVEAGRLVDRTPLEAVALAFPGAGSGTAYTVGHPEPLTLHRTLDVRGRSACLMVVTRATVAFLDGLRREVDAGKLTLDEAAEQVARPGALRQARAAVGAFGHPGPGALPPFFALATGTRDGQAAACGASLVGVPAGMADFTGIPAALALAQLVDGTAAGPGVHPPEAVVDADRLFDDLAPFCLLPVEDGRALVELSVSPAVGAPR